MSANWCARWSREHRLLGLKVHRYDARITREICEAARAYRLPVLYDVMGEVSVCELLATEYPDVPFIIPHLGSFADDWRAQLAFIDPLARHPNVFTDTSGVRRFDLLAQAVQRAGARKDSLWLGWPVAASRRGIGESAALEIAAAEEGSVLGGNLPAIMRRVRRTPVRSSPSGTRARSAPVEGEFRDPWAQAMLGQSSQKVGPVLPSASSRPPHLQRTIGDAEPSGGLWRLPFSSSSAIRMATSVARVADLFQGYS